MWIEVCRKALDLEEEVRYYEIQSTVDSFWLELSVGQMRATLSSALLLSTQLTRVEMMRVE